MISYCIAVLRPAYARLLVEELVRKTSARFEILLWLNTSDSNFEEFVVKESTCGTPVRIAGKSPENIGMLAYRELFRSARFPLVVQIDDDVVTVSRGIAERAERLFGKFPKVRQLVADVWQDEYTTGARPPLSVYQEFDRNEGLYDGPIDGWFSIYHRSILPLIDGLPFGEYFPIGWSVREKLMRQGMRGLLDTGMKVFHVIGPAYASFFGMLDFEIAKYQRLGRNEIVEWYREGKKTLPATSELAARIEGISRILDQ